MYLDCDTVVAQSLKHLWNVRLGDRIAGAVMEPTIYKEVKESIGLGPEDGYFNSGVLLVNLKKWREENIQEKLLEFWKEKGGKLFASDQDVINGTLKRRILPLPPRYNFLLIIGIFLSSLYLLPIGQLPGLNFGRQSIIPLSSNIWGMKGRGLQEI